MELKICPVTSERENWNDTKSTVIKPSLLFSLVTCVVIGLRIRGFKRKKWNSYPSQVSDLKLTCCVCSSSSLGKLRHPLRFNPPSGSFISPHDVPSSLPLLPHPPLMHTPPPLMVLESLRVCVTHNHDAVCKFITTRPPKKGLFMCTLHRGEELSHHPDSKVQQQKKKKKKPDFNYDIRLPSNNIHSL